MPLGHFGTERAGHESSFGPPTASLPARQLVWAHQDSGPAGRRRRSATAGTRMPLGPLRDRASRSRILFRPTNRLATARQLVWAHQPPGMLASASLLGESRVESGPPGLRACRSVASRPNERARILGRHTFTSRRFSRSGNPSHVGSTRDPGTPFGRFATKRAGANPGPTHLRLASLRSLGESQSLGSTRVSSPRSSPGARRQSSTKPSSGASWIGRDPIGAQVRFADADGEDAPAPSSTAAPLPWMEIVGDIGASRRRVAPCESSPSTRSKSRDGLTSRSPCRCHRPFLAVQHRPSQLNSHCPVRWPEVVCWKGLPQCQEGSVKLTRLTIGASAAAAILGKRVDGPRAAIEWTATAGSHAGSFPRFLDPLPQRGRLLRLRG